jgi:hypothetical protein
MEIPLVPKRMFPFMLCVTGDTVLHSSYLGSTFYIERLQDYRRPIY